MKYINTRKMNLQVIPTPDYILAQSGEMVARAPRTGQMFIVRRSGRRLACGRVSVDIFDVDTVVREVDGRPSVVGVRGQRIAAGQA